MQTEDSRPGRDDGKRSQPQKDSEPRRGQELPKALRADSHEVGMLRVGPESGKTPEETQWMQEHHNSGHALWYLAMAAHSVVSGKRMEEGPRRTRIVLAHLTCLREFLRIQDTRLKSIVTRLIDTLVTESPADDMSWRHFLHTHWFLIRSFAEHYGQHEKCFSRGLYRKVSDVQYGRQYLRLWRWESLFKRAFKALRRHLRTGFFRARTPDREVAARFEAFFRNKMQAAAQLLTLPPAKREPLLIQRITQSIDDIFHHFCPRDRRTEGLFEELIALLKRCPGLTEEEDRRGRGPPR